MTLENFLIDIDVLWDRVGKGLYEKPDARAGRKMRVQVINDGIVEDLTGYTLNLGWVSTKDATKFGLDVFEVVDITEGIFEIPYTSGMLSNLGYLTGTLQLVPPVGNTIESNNFVITVVKSGIDAEAIQSETSFTALATALVEVNGWNDRIDVVEADFIARANNLDTIYPTRLVSLEQQLAQTVDCVNVAAENGYDNVGSFLNVKIAAGFNNFFFDSGIFNYDESVILKSGVTLFGVNKGTTLFKRNGNFSFFKGLGVPRLESLVNGADRIMNVKMADFQLVTSILQSEPFMYLRAFSYFNFENVVCYGLGNPIAMVEGFDSRFVNCDFTSNGDYDDTNLYPVIKTISGGIVDGYNIEKTNQIVFIGCRFEYYKHSVISDVSAVGMATNNLVFESCKFESPVSRVPIFSFNLTCYSNYFTNCYVIAGTEFPHSIFATPKIERSYIKSTKIGIQPINGFLPYAKNMFDCPVIAGSTIEITNISAASVTGVSIFSVNPLGQMSNNTHLITPEAHYINNPYANAMRFNAKSKDTPLTGTDSSNTVYMTTGTAKMVSFGTEANDPLRLGRAFQAPATDDGARLGDIIFNKYPQNSDVFAWVCTDPVTYTWKTVRFT